MAPRRVRRGALVLALASVFALGACVGATDRSDFEAELQRRGGGVTSELVAEPLGRLRTALGVDDPELLLLSIVPLDRSVVMEVRDPLQRRNVDRYTSRDGGLDDPEPVQIRAGDDLDARSFRVSELPALGDLEGLADEAVARLGFADAYVAGISVGMRNGDPVVVVQVTSPRSTGSAVFDADGELLGAEQS